MLFEEIHSDRSFSATTYETNLIDNKLNRYNLTDIDVYDEVKRMLQGLRPYFSYRASLYCTILI